MAVSNTECRITDLLCSATLGCVLLFLSLFLMGEHGSAQPLPDNISWEGRGATLETLRIQESFAQENLVARELLPPRPTLKAYSYALRRGNNREIESLLYPRPTIAYGLVSEGEWRDTADTYFGALHFAVLDYGARRWTKLSMPQRFYPYLALDSAEAQPRGVAGSLALGILRKMELSTFALALEYSGERLHATGGTEHREARHELRLRQGVSIPLGAYWFSQWGQFAYLRQEHRAMAEHPVRFFRHIGFGLWHWDRTTSERQMDFESTSGLVKCGLQLAPKQEGLLASVGAAHRWGTTGDIHQRSVASFVLQELNLLLGYDYKSGAHHLQGALDASWQNRTGVEQFYDSVGRRGNKKYQLLFSEPSYKARYRAYGVQFGYSQEAAAQWTYGARLWGGYTSQESEYKRPNSKLSLMRWKTEMTLHLAWLHAQHHWRLQAAWVFLTRAAEVRELSRYIREPLRSEFLLPELERQLPARHYLMAELEYRHALPNGVQLSVAPEVGYLRAVGLGDDIWRGGLRIGVLF